MKHPKINRKIVAVSGTVFIALSTFLCPVSTLTTQAAATGETEIQPMQAIIQWVFRVENNKLYKRLYNYSTGNWVGEWIFVRDV